MVTQDLDTHLRTLSRLRRIASESRRGDTGVTDEIEARAEAVLERVWSSSAAEASAFRDSTFVTIAGDGAVQFEWESGEVAVEAIVEPDGGFTVYIHRENNETEECSPAELTDAVEVIERGWGGARRAAGGV